MTAKDLLSMLKDMDPETEIFIETNSPTSQEWEVIGAVERDTPSQDEDDDDRCSCQLVLLATKMPHGL